MAVTIPASTEMFGYISLDADNGSFSTMEPPGVNTTNQTG